MQKTSHRQEFVGRILRRRQAQGSGQHQHQAKPFVTSVHGCVR